MSKKKRQLRKKSAAPGEFKPSATLNAHPANQPIDISDQSNAKPIGFGLLRFLKSHLLLFGIVAFLALGALGAGLKYLEEDARRQILNGDLKPGNGENQGFLNRINPFIPLPSPTPTPQLSKEYLYAGDRLLAVEDANAAPPADLAVWRPSTGWWFVRGPDGTIEVSAQWGGAAHNDRPVPGDYDGDGKTDFSVFRPGDFTWYVLYSSNGSYNGFAYGAANDIEAPADYDGDGRTDLAVLRPSTATPVKYTWIIQKSSDGLLLTPEFGDLGDTPAPADYDGDGKADVAVWRPSQKTFHVRRSSDEGYQGQQITAATSDKPVCFDYDGDGKDDYAIFNSSGTWLIVKSTIGGLVTTSFGQTDDIPVPNDYDGDGKVDIAVWRPNGGNWYILQSSKTAPDDFRGVQWGANGDVPVPAFYRR